MGLGPPSPPAGALLSDIHTGSNAIQFRHHVYMAALGIAVHTCGWSIRRYVLGQVFCMLRKILLSLLALAVHIVLLLWWPPDHPAGHQALAHCCAGSYGQVFKAMRCRVQPVAIKVFTAEATELQMEDFEKELVILKSCRDRNIVQFLGACITDSQTCLVTECDRPQALSTLHACMLNCLPAGISTAFQPPNRLHVLVLLQTRFGVMGSHQPSERPVHSSPMHLATYILMFILRPAVLRKLYWINSTCLTAWLAGRSPLP